MSAMKNTPNTIRYSRLDRVLRRAATARPANTVRRFVAAVAVATATLTGLAGTAQAVDLMASAPPLFGSQGTPSPDVSQFTKWTRMLAAFQTERAQAEQPCAGGDCKLQQWLVYVESLRGLDRFSQIVQVNTRMNSAAYIEDARNYGASDYWATPGQFFTRSGDCEDYAIAKYMTLRELGFSDRDMRIAVVHDTQLNLVHAILIVYHNDEAYVLDNQIDQVVRASSISHYRPYFSLNQTMWWRHAGSTAVATSS